MAFGALLDLMPDGVGSPRLMTPGISSFNPPFPSPAFLSQDVNIRKYDLISMRRSHQGALRPRA